ncbi:MAG: hypothetical protein HY303_19275, partial [Candidatus Wallbacteria bacterium]|nr:hypothetical protein [Candidatus Wallbacteria bacterium]
FRVTASSAARGSSTDTVLIEATAAGPGTHSVCLDRGLNNVGIPLSPVTTGRAFDLADLLLLTGANFLVRTRAPPGASGRFEARFPRQPQTPFALSPDRGYLLSTPASRSVTFTGWPWPVR